MIKDIKSAIKFLEEKKEKAPDVIKPYLKIYPGFKEDELNGLPTSFAEFLRQIDPSSLRLGYLTFSSSDARQGQYLEKLQEFNNPDTQPYYKQLEDEGLIPVAMAEQDWITVKRANGQIFLLVVDNGETLEIANNFTDFFLAVINFIKEKDDGAASKESLNSILESFKIKKNWFWDLLIDNTLN